MIPRYETKEIRDIWTDQNRFQRWLDVEIAACQAWNEKGEIPDEDFLNIKTKISSFFGKISYSLYLTHGLAGGAVAVFTVVRIPDHWRMILAISTSIVFAFIYYLLVEKWFLKWSKRVRYD